MAMCANTPIAQEDMREALLNRLWELGMDGNTAAARLWLDSEAGVPAPLGEIELPDVIEETD